MLNAIMLNVAMLSVVAPKLCLSKECHFQNVFVEKKILAPKVELTRKGELRHEEDQRTHSGVNVGNFFFFVIGGE